MTLWLISAIVVFFTVMDFVIIGTIIRAGWGPLPREFPAAQAGADAVTRRYQSFRLGLLNLGFCIHVAVDEQSLHLEPIKPLQAFGARTASIPWDAIAIEKRSRSGKWITVRIGKHALTGPAWCLEMARPESEERSSIRS